MLNLPSHLIVTARLRGSSRAHTKEIFMASRNRNAVATPDQLAADPAVEAVVADVSADLAQDEAGAPLVALSPVTEDLSAAEIPAGASGLTLSEPGTPGSWDLPQAEDAATPDEPQAGFEVVSEIPAIRQPKVKYADAVEYCRANPGAVVKVALTGKTSAVGAAQTIRRNFPDVSVTVRTDPATGVPAAYARFIPASA
jgi:hypothetical protein